MSRLDHKTEIYLNLQAMLNVIISSNIIQYHSKKVVIILP